MENGRPNKQNAAQYSYWKWPPLPHFYLAYSLGKGQMHIEVAVIQQTALRFPNSNAWPNSEGVDSNDISRTVMSV